MLNCCVYSCNFLASFLGQGVYLQGVYLHVIEMTQKYQIPTMLLIMVGNPTETQQDYEFTKQWFRDRYKYAGNSVDKISLALASILPGTEWHRKQDEMNLQVGKYPSIWINQDIKITLEQRTSYWNELLEICEPFMIKKKTDQVALSQKNTIKL
jgi:hypothetical protein